MAATYRRLEVTTMDTTQAFAQGARCGHLEGKGRAGSYCLGEEVELSWEASEAQDLDHEPTTAAWARGYRHGYRRAAEGSELEQDSQI